MKRFFWVLFVMSLWGHLLMAQEKAVSGIVVSTEDGLPMIGVAVVDKQTMNGVTTNEKGEFSMTVSPRTKTLHLSYLGYKTKEVTISGRSMKIEMEPDMVAIDEVMVVAYGTGKKSTFTGSASVVKKESLEKIKASNVTQALQGQSSGVQVLNNSGEPGEDATIMIRGIGSMNASSSPLYVVDGTAYDGYLNAINPNDIESMTILKDVDYFPRPGKSGGAWMSNYREQSGPIRPLVCNVCSFTKPIGDTPSLLTMDEVETLFHEFGHALHGLLTQCKYKGTSGTNVVRDFVELPSQINEHWATEPEVLKMYAKHYATGKVIPDEIIEKILQQKTFNQGFMTTELLAAAILDMNLHMLKDVKNLDVVSYEKEAMDKLNLISEIAPRYRVTYFNHIIGGYAAGYYSYLWANVLDNDAFEAFKEHGIFDKNTAELFRRNVLEKGDSEDPMTLYKNFRGTEPSMEPLLKNRGMK